MWASLVVELLYKNSDKQFVDLFWQGGEVMLRPLHYFVTIEDSVRKDVMEGQRNVSVRPEEIIHVESGEFWAGGGNVAIRSTSDKKTFIQMHPRSNVHFGEQIDQAYIFCVSEEVRPEFGDSAYCIADPNGFGRTLAKALKNHGVPVTRCTVQRVRYGLYKDLISRPLTTEDEYKSVSRQLLAEDDFGPYIVKPSRFAADREWRYVFVVAPETAVQNEMKVRDGELRKFCQRVP